MQENSDKIRQTSPQQVLQAKMEAEKCENQNNKRGKEIDLKILPKHLKRFLFTSVKNSCRMKVDFGNTRKSLMYAKRFENCKNGMILAINQPTDI